MEFKGIFIIALSIVGFVNAACNNAYAQCGGKNFKGENCCVSGFTCNSVNEWYSQCVPGSANPSNSAIQPNMPSNNTPPQNNNTPPQNSNIPPQNNNIPPQNNNIPPQNNNIPPQNNANTNQSSGFGTGNKPRTIFIAGDSTADNYGANNGKTNGWGKYLGDYVTSTVNNQAKSGQSARSYWRDGRWKNLINGVSKGDYVFIQFGHNDVGGPNAKTERGSAGGEGDETVTVTLSNGQQEIVHTFPWYISQMAKQVIAKGATPVVMSYTPNFSFVNGKVPEGSRFQGYMKLVATQLNIPFIDLYSYIARQWEKLGENYIKSNNWFPTDYKHTAPAAADLNAQLILNAAKCQNLKDLVAALNDKGKRINYPCTV